MKLQPVIETLQAIDKGQTCDIDYVCAQLTNVIKHIREFPVDYDIETLRPRIELSNVKLAKRWGCATTTYYDWIKKDRAQLYFLLRGAEVNAGRCNYPLIDPNDLETVCNERGFEIAELCRVTGVCRNSVKGWSRNRTRVKRAWDLIEGYTAEANSK